MKLYEATNGFTGYSYVRCLVWANNEEEALKLARKSFQESGQGDFHGERYWNNIELSLIVDAEKEKEPFYTEPTD